MSQPTPRTEQPPQRTPSKIGGLPMWGWVAIAAAGGVVVLLWWRSRQSSQTTAPTATTDTSGNDIASELSVLQTEIQNLQGQPSQPIPIPATSAQLGNTPPITQTGGSTARQLGFTTVIDGKSLNELLTAFGETQQQFEQDNPGIQATYRSYIAGRGYVPAGTPGARIVLNVGQPRNVKVPGGWGNASA